MADFAMILTEGRDPLKTGAIPPSTPVTGKLPQVKKRREKIQQNPTRNIESIKVAPIWLGSGLKEEVIHVKEIKQIVPEEMHHNENVLAIERFESDAGPYEAQKKYVMAAESLEQAINLRRKFLGDMHRDFLTAIERYVVSCNLWGIQCLNAGQNSSALELLMKAEGLTEADNVPNFKRRVSLRAATFNNLCCYFRARGKLNAALQFAEKALKIEQKFKDAENPARTHLNYAVLLSMMNRHEESVEHIESAIAILHDDERQISYQTSEPEDKDGDNSREQQHQEVVSTLVVAYYNHWVELGRLSRREAGIDCILRAANIAKRKLGAAHALTVKMEETLTTVQEQMTKAPGFAHTLDTTDGLPEMAHTDRQAMIVPQQLPPLDSSGAWQTAKKKEGLKLAIDAPQITVRFQREPLRPPVPLPGKTALANSLKSMRLRSTTDFAPPEIKGSVFDSRPKMESIGGFAGSPSIQQQCFGTQPMMTKARQLEEKRPPTGGGDPRTISPAPGQMSQKLEPKPPTEAPSSPYLREAYAYHMKQAAKRKSMDGQEEPDLPLERDRIRAINVFKGRLEQRRGRGLPTPTESNRIRAATMIQALFRGFIVRQWTAEELAKDVTRKQHEAEIRALEYETALDGDLNPRPGPADMKRRVAFRVVYAARRAFVEYSAAVKMQKAWRGWVTRRDIRSEIVRVANETAMLLQALFKRYGVVVKLTRRDCAAISMQSYWRRAVIQRQAQKKSEAVKLVTRAAMGFATRKRLLLLQQNAVPVQCVIRGFLMRNNMNRRHVGALALQRVFRGWRWRRSHAVVCKAALKISALWRGHTLRKRLRQRHAAGLRIQRRYRFSRAEARCAKMQTAASKVGAAWRGFQLRKNKTCIASACKIQSHMRGVLVRERLRRVPLAALRIQSAWHKHQVRRDARTKVALATVLQRLTRRHLINRKLGGVVAATVLCQKLVRGSRTRKRWKLIQARISRVQAVWRSRWPRRSIIAKERAAQRIQTFVRRVQAQRCFKNSQRAVARIKAFWDARRIRLAMKDLNKVVRTIAKWVRGHLIRRRRQRLNFAAMQIQRCWHGHHWRATLKKRQQAARRIQTMLLGRYRQVCYNTFRQRAVIGIQRIWKAKKARRRFVAQKAIARLLQNQLRGHYHRKRVASEYRAAQQIQAAWKRVMWKGRVDLRNRSAAKVQSAVLGMIDRKVCRQQTKCAVMMQCVVRGYKARHRRDARIPAARKIACWMRSRIYRMRLQEQRQAVRKIQDCFRARQTRRRYLKLKRFVNLMVGGTRRRELEAKLDKQRAAVCTIQKCWRRTAVSMRLNDHVEAAVVVQKFIRGWLAVLKARREQAVKLKLVLALQSHWRRKKDQRIFQKQRHLQEMVARLMRVYCQRKRNKLTLKAPATRLVCACKIRLARRRVVRQREAARMIQRHARGYLTRKHVKFAREEGPVPIQCWFRQRRAKRLVETRRYWVHHQDSRGKDCHESKQQHMEKTAAVQLQAFHRMRFQRNRFQRQMKWALPKIQALNRMFLDRDEYRSKRDAAVYIQKSVRAFCFCKPSRQHCAARKIQQKWRSHLVKPSNPGSARFSEFVEKTNAAKTIQTVFRRYRKNWKYLRILVGTVRIQALARMHLRRKHWRIQRKAATKIQASLLLVALAKRRVNHRRQCVLKMQAMVRRGLVRSQVVRELAAAFKMQSAWRSCLTRVLDVRRKNTAATKLQANFRMRYQHKVMYPRRRAALKHIQSHGRGFLVRKHMADKNVAAARIQIRYRINKTARRLERTRWLVLALQKLWRGKTSRRSTARIGRHIRQRPALVRGKIARSKMKSKLLGCIIIQRLWRGRAGRLQFKGRCNAARTIQCQMRMFLSRKKARILLRAKLAITRLALRWQLKQSSRSLTDAYSMAARAHEVHGPVEHHRKQIDSVVHIQRVARGAQGRKRVWHMHDAACIVQKHARNWLARGRVHKRLGALAKMQASFDGAYRRKRLADALGKVRKLQDYMRMHLARKKFLQKRESEVHIARVKRGGAGRTQLEKQQAAALVLTRRAHTMLEVKRYGRKHKAAAYIQKICRGRLTREYLKEKNAAASIIMCSWRKHRQEKSHKAKCKSVAVVFGGSIMWRQVALRKRRVNAATTIAAAWRSYVWRAQLQRMHNAARKIQKARRTLSMMSFTRDMAVEVLVRAKLIREAYRTKHAIVIQRSFRRWRDKKEPPIKRLRKAVAVLQAHYRRHQATRFVKHVRRIIGLRLKRFAQAPVVLHPDAKTGLLTRSRDISSSDNVEALPAPLRLKYQLHISGMSSAQREELGFAVAPVQAMAKFQYRVKKAEDIQRVWRTHAARRVLQQKRERAIQIQAVWRAKIARNRLRRARAAATKIQSHVRRMLAMSARRKATEDKLVAAFAALSDLGDEVVDGRRVRPGGSVCAG